MEIRTVGHLMGKYGNGTSMKRLIIVFIGLAFGLGQAVAQGGEQPVDTRITEVKVFQGQAQVVRSGRARINAGKTDIVLRGLTAALDPGSIQVTGRGHFTILGISHRQNFMEERAVPRALTAMEDSLVLLGQYMWLEKNQKTILEKEEQMLLNSQNTESKERPTVAELKATADFLRARLQENALLRVKQDDKIRVLQRRETRLRAQIQEQKDLYSKHTSEIVVHISADAAGNAELDAQYIVNNAGWTALYDLRARDTKSPVELSYKANVFQRTGEDWKDVKLTLSTSNPALGGLKPELNTWYLNFAQPVINGYYSVAPSAREDVSAVKDISDALSGKVAGLEVERGRADTSSAIEVHTVQTALHAEFVIDLPYSVSSSAKPTLVDIRQHSLPAEFIYSVAPKLDNDAFLMARVTGWEAFDLLPGEASVFFEGTFVGRTMINPSVVNDTLPLSLGRDKRIVVKREKINDKTSTSVVGARKREASSYAITVRNAKADAIRIVVEDQVPVSLNNQIEVSLFDLGGAHREENTGKLTWELQIKAGETKKVVYGFEVKFPKGKEVEGA